MRDLFLSPDTGDIVVSGSNPVMVEGTQLTTQLIRNEILEPLNRDTMAEKPFGTDIVEMIGMVTLPPQAIAALVQTKASQAIRQVQQRMLDELNRRRWTYAYNQNNYAHVLAKSAHEIIREIRKIDVEITGSTIEVDIYLLAETGTLIIMPTITVFDRTF